MINLLFLISNFTVLLISDAKIAFDAFRNGMAATVFAKTVITVNPGEKAPHTKAKHRCQVFRLSRLDVC